MMDKENRQSMRQRQRQSERWSGRGGETGRRWTVPYFRPEGLQGQNERGGICEASNGADGTEDAACRDRPSASADANHASNFSKPQNKSSLSHTRFGRRRSHTYPRDGQAETELITRRSGLGPLWGIPGEMIEEEWRARG